MKPIALQDTTTREKAQNGRGWSEDGTSYTLDAAATQGVAIPLDLRNAGRDPEKHDEINRQGVGVGAPGEPSHTISTACVHGVAYGIDSHATTTSEKDAQSHKTGGPRGMGISKEVSPTLCSERTQAVAFGGDIARTLQARHDSSPCADRGQDVVAVGAFQQCSGSPKAALSYRNETAPSLTGGQDHQMCHTGMAVRRLTPKECERLQGFPDNHTLIPWRGKPAEQCPDGPRYKALGNSMAVPCMAWIGSRIAARESQPLRYLSVCSGIEAASMAWEPLGWQPAAFAEVEKFPSAVLAHHWPQVPNLGDMTRYESWDLGAIDLLVGGTPCQSFSVAGLRKGLRDPRGGLMLTYLEIARRFGPRWLVWENVPGVLSSHGGRDFGAFLGALGALGYGWAYRVLDAQWFGVAQRRRRVFVIANLGDGAAPAKVLFERESVCRNPAPSREAGERTAADAAGCAGDGRRGGYDVTGAIDCRIGAQRAQNAQAGHYVADTSGTIDAHYYKGCGSAAFAEREVVACLTDGAHNGGGLTAKMPTRAAYLPALANPLTARMGKGINTTLDEGQTPIVEGRDDL